VTGETSGTGDFTQASRHVFGGTVTNWDCIVCHREGDENAAAQTPGTVGLSGVHQNAQVDMRNVDNLGDATLVWNKFDGTCDNGTDTNITDCVDNAANWTWNTEAMLFDMDNFCMGCHDIDGASAINVTTADDGVNLDATNALTPFNSTDEVSAGTGGGTVSMAGYERLEVLDVATQFDPVNPSHHAVIQPAYSSHNANWGSTAWVDRELKNATMLITDNIYESAQLHCADCHTVDYSAHGGAEGFMLQASSIDGTCYLCHESTAYFNNTAGSTDTRWDHSLESSTMDAGQGAIIGQYGGTEGSVCLNCHGGYIGEGGSFIDGFGGIHGLPYDATACEASPGTGNPDCDPRSGEPRYRFQGGSYMAHQPGSWTAAGGTSTCYFAGNKNQDWSNCAKHTGTEDQRTGPMEFDRGVPGDY
jgi:hypothetical protein